MAARLAGLFTLALMLGACGGPAPAGEETAELDAAPAPTTETAPDAYSPPPGPDAAPAPAPDARPVPPAPDAAALAPDGGADSAAPAVTPDAGPLAPDGASSGDAAAAADAAPAPICPDSSIASCRVALQADEEIRNTFTDSCDGLPYRQCGGVIEDGHIVVTYPMNCVAGAWRLAAGWNGSSVVYAYACSRGCGAAGVLCAP